MSEKLLQKTCEKIVLIQEVLFLSQKKKEVELLLLLFSSISFSLLKEINFPFIFSIWYAFSAHRIKELEFWWILYSPSTINVLFYDFLFLDNLNFFSIFLFSKVISRLFTVCDKRKSLNVDYLKKETLSHNIKVKRSRLGNPFVLMTSFSLDEKMRFIASFILSS